MIPASRVGSSPGCTWSQTSAAVAYSDRRGSITMTDRPRSLARRKATNGFVPAMRRLVDRQRGVERRRVKPRVPRSRHGHRRRVLVGTGAGVARNRPGPVLGDDGSDPLGDRVQCCGRGCLNECGIAAPSQGRTQAAGVVVLDSELAALDARVALEQRIVHHPSHGNRPLARARCVHVDLDRARRVAHPAERSAGLRPGAVGGE